MRNRSIIPLYIAGVIGLGAAAKLTSLSLAGADDAVRQPPPSASASAPKAATAATYRSSVVKASNAFLRSLTSSQRSTARYSFKDQASKAAWSNFPAFFVERTGVAYMDMSSAAQKRADALARTVLSDKDYAQYQDIRKADDFAGEAEGNDGFGSGNYYVSIFGSPSATQPFMVSFNGHHMTYNVTLNNTTDSSTPQFTGAEPTDFRRNGQRVRPMKTEAAAVFNLLPGLPSSARLSESFDDILVGPGEDGNFPSQRSGVRMTSLSGPTEKRVKQLIRAYTSDVDKAIGGPTLARYVKQYENTFVAYSGGTTDVEGTYLRIDGPRVWIELQRQETDFNSSHYHSVFRDKQSDYGE